MLPEYFQHPDGRLIYSLEYRCACGSTIIVQLGPDGRCRFNRTTKEDGKPVVTAKPGDVLLNDGQRFVVEWVKVWRQSRIIAD